MTTIVTGVCLCLLYAAMICLLAGHLIATFLLALCAAVLAMFVIKFDSGR